MVRSQRMKNLKPADAGHPEVQQNKRWRLRARQGQCGPAVGLDNVEAFLFDREANDPSKGGVIVDHQNIAHRNPLSFTTIRFIGG